MPLEKTEDVLEALRESGLLAPGEFETLARELSPFGGDVRLVLAHVLKRDRVTRYQLGKVLSGRAADLFIGPYVITDRLGAGGMGKVYRARVGAHGREVALKVVRSALVENPTVRGRYEREVQASSQLDHPNIVAVFDAGEANGRVYMAMEFVDGIDLARMMREFEMLAVPEACEYARQVALGLAHAHARGFVHRDVKPSNIVVAGERHVPQATEPAVVKLLDLGLARALDPLDMVAPDLTRDHTVVGTPDYMAPEQARDSKTVDGRADLYGLGCTLYFLLTGRVPFPAEGAIGKIIAHMSQIATPLQALRPDIPTAVAELVARMMAKRPDDRIQTAAEVVVELAPHARYPHGAPPVEMLPGRGRDRAGTRGGSHGDTGTGRSTLPSSSHGSPVDPLEVLDPSRHDSASPPNKRSLAAVAPVPLVGRAPPTPRPRGERPPKDPPAPKADVAPPANKPRRKQKKPRRLGVPPYVWVLLALWGFAVLALTYWFVTK